MIEKADACQVLMWLFSTSISLEKTAMTALIILLFMDFIRRWMISAYLA
jgi:hypothetical protein